MCSLINLEIWIFKVARSHKRKFITTQYVDGPSGEE